MMKKIMKKILIGLLILSAGISYAGDDYLLIGGWQDELTDQANSNDVAKVKAKVKNILANGMPEHPEDRSPMDLATMSKFKMTKEGPNKDRIIIVMCFNVRALRIDLDATKLDAWCEANLSNPNLIYRKWARWPKTFITSKGFVPVPKE